MVQICRHRLQLIAYCIDKLTGDKRLCLEYKQWDRLITVKYGIIVEGWPLDNFHKPSNCKNRAKLQKLLDAVNSGKCRLRKLNTAEWEAWKKTHVPWNTVDPSYANKSKAAVRRQILAAPSHNQGSVDAERGARTPDKLPAPAPGPSATTTIPAHPMVATQGSLTPHTGNISLSLPTLPQPPLQSSAAPHSTAVHRPDNRLTISNGTIIIRPL